MAEDVVAASTNTTSRGTSRQRPIQDALPWWGLILAFFFIAAALISRKPELIFRAQFRGDEALWFANAYANGALHAILQPQAGYLCIASKLAIPPALHVPLLYAPAIFGLFAVGTYALVGWFLATTRLAHAASLQSRLLLCFFWIILPNADEVLSLNETQWMLAPLGLAILLSSTPTKTWWKIFDLVSIAVISVTGPFSVLLLPIAVIWWTLRRSKWTVILAGILGIGCCIQLVTLRHNLTPCTPREILNPLLARLSAGQIFLFGTLNGGNILPHATISTSSVTYLAILILAAGISITVYAGLNGDLELKLFIAFAGLVFAAAIWRLRCDPGWAWQTLMNVDYAIRYWYIPRLAVCAILVWMIGRQRPAWIRATAGAAIVLLAVFAFANWRYPAPPYQDFRRYALAFEHAPQGTQMSIPVSPPGWKIILVKH